MTTTIDRDQLIADLEAVQMRDFHRLAHPVIYEAYCEFVASGKYPYIASVVKFIGEKYDLDESLGAGTRCHEPQTPLSHEVYLASHQYRTAEMVAREQMLLAEGFRPITDYEPRVGERIEVDLAPGRRVVYRVAAATIGDFCLLEPRKRIHGLSLRGLVEQHRAYIGAKEEGFTRMNGPHVRMFRPVP